MASGWRAGCGRAVLRPCHPSDEHRGVARTPAGEDRSPRHGAADARLSRLAARREAPLQHGGDPDGSRRRMQDGRTASASNLVTERTRIVNRIKAMLARFGIRTLRADAAQGRGTLGGAAHRRKASRCRRNTLAELRRDLARLRVVSEQIKQIEQAACEQLAAGPGGQAACDGTAACAGPRRRGRDGGHAGPRGPSRATCAIAGRSRATPALPARRMRAAERREKGLAKAGNARVRRGMIQLAWRFLEVPEGQRPGAMVSAAHRRRPRQHPQDDDRGAGAQAAHRAVASGDDWRGAGGLVLRPAS